MTVVPVPGLVIRYSYLWASEHRQGREDGSKDRPCVVVLAAERMGDGSYFVTVVPITHSPPRNQTTAVEIPVDTKRRLGLDDERSWVVFDDANRFSWPGPDIRPISDDDSSFVYGILPYKVIARVRSAFIAAVRAKLLTLVPRTE